MGVIPSFRERSIVARLVRNRRIWLLGFMVLIIVHMDIPMTMAARLQTSSQISALSVAPTGAVPIPFKHPGLLDTKAHLDYVKLQVNKGTEPWFSAFNKAKASPYASLSWTPKPRATVACGSRSNPNLGCSDERSDAAAAYTDAIIWYINGDARYASKAVQIMDAWSAMLKSHTLSNARLQAGWAGSVFPSAAELIRYTYSSWTAAGI